MAKPTDRPNNLHPRSSIIDPEIITNKLPSCHGQARTRLCPHNRDQPIRTQRAIRESSVIVIVDFIQIKILHSKFMTLIEFETLIVVFNLSKKKYDQIISSIKNSGKESKCIS